MCHTECAESINLAVVGEAAYQHEELGGEHDHLIEVETPSVELGNGSHPVEVTHGRITDGFASGDLRRHLESGGSFGSNHVMTIYAQEGLRPDAEGMLMMEERYPIESLPRETPPPRRRRRDRNREGRSISWGTVAAIQSINHRLDINENPVIENNHQPQQ